MFDNRPHSTPRALVTDVSIATKVALLRDPRNYPDDEDRIEVVETHFSWVFLTRHHAYKLKKPASGEGFDFRSIQARLRNALAEVRLNRRLAPNVYLGIIPLARQPEGALQLYGGGTPIDWLVKMRRLESDRMLDKRLSDCRWTYAELEALAQRLAQFFATARSVQLTSAAHLRAIRLELHRALRVMSDRGEPRLLHASSVLVRSLGGFLARHERVFRRRIGERRVVDGHGDLRPEHVYLKGIPQIIDCLEFREDLRRADPLSELAFLVLECNRLAPSPIERLLFRRYRQRCRDRAPRELIAFYTAFNALIRARLAVEHIAEPGGRSREQWIERAIAYLAVAARASRIIRSITVGRGSNRCRT